MREWQRHPCAPVHHVRFRFSRAAHCAYRPLLGVRAHDAVHNLIRNITASTFFRAPGRKLLAVTYTQRLSPVYPILFFSAGPHVRLRSHKTTAYPGRKAHRSNDSTQGRRTPTKNIPLIAPTCGRQPASSSRPASSQPASSSPPA